ncbi:MAG: precorrin-3B synthase [Nocardioidaceae bacterium]
MPATHPVDACPGVLQPHQAADGALVRLRIPGGSVPSATLVELASIAAAHGDGRLSLTSRGNLQLRGFTGGVPASEIAALGLVPSATHERVRNIAASPLSGRVGGLADVRPVVRRLDEALCAEPRLAALPGRFLFGADDGRGDVAQLDTDLAAVAVDEAHAEVVIGGGVSGPVVPLAFVPEVLAALAIRFLEVAAGAWHVRDLPRAGAELVEGEPTRAELPAPRRMPYGVVLQEDGAAAVSVLAPLGTLDGAQVDALAADADELVLTPWRGVVVPDLDPAGAPEVVEAATGAGLVADPASPWHRVTACVGAPGCVKAGGETGPVAREIVSARVDGLVHVVGCERRCGAPAEPHDLVLVGAG